MALIGAWGGLANGEGGQNATEPRRRLFRKVAGPAKDLERGIDFLGLFLS